MSEAVKLQDPGETLDYSFDWTAWLAGDTILSSAWAVTPTGPTISGQAVAGNVTTTLIAGVAFGGIYTLKNVILTNQGRTADDSVLIRGANK